MRILETRLKSFILLAVAALSYGTAHADELLVMPYTCSIANGKPVLKPSSDQGYRIIGKRETRRHIACSPTRRAHCRRWTVHRFNVDCTGTTVPWTDIVVASDEKDRVWLEGDQLAIRMPLSWTIAPSDPCAQFRMFDERRRYGPREQYCAERMSNIPKPIIRMPHGFAPKFGMDAIFVEAKSPHDSAAATNGQDAAEQTTWTIKRPPKIPPLPEQHRTEPRPDTQKPQLAASNKITNNTPTEKETVIGADKLKTLNNKSLPIIINKPNTSPDKHFVAKTEDSSTEPESARNQVAATEGLKQTPKTSAPGTKAETPKNTSDQPTHHEGSSNETPLPYVLAGLVIAGLTILTGWFISRRQIPWPTHAPKRDIASVSLTGNDLTTTPATHDVIQENNPKTTPKATPTKASAQNTRNTPDKIGDRIPQTKEDALKVLGMSVKPDADPKAMKKIVDGLRMSWHPDHAENETDRKLREMKLKQINAAWEIIAAEITMKTNQKLLARSKTPSENR